MRFLKSDLILVVSFVLLLKLILVGLSLADALGAFVILGSFIAKTVTDYQFPQRPDLFKEMIDLQNRQSALEAEKDQIQSDLTALKFGAVRK